MMTRWIAGCCCGLALAAAALPAAAQAPEGAPPADAESTTARVERLYLEGVALYKESKFRAALEKFDEAYALFPDPNLLYNAGRSLEALGELDAARARFERCAASPDVAADLKDKAHKRLAAIQEAQANSAAVVEPPPDDPAQTGGAQPPTAAAPAEGGGALGVLKWGAGASALGLLGAGGAFFALGASDHAELEDAIAEGSGGVSSLTRVQAQELAESGEDRKTLGVILLGAGGGMAAITALLFYLDAEDAPRDATTLRLKPALGPQGAMITLGGGF